jgi:glucose dehydrogenase
MTMTQWLKSTGPGSWALIGVTLLLFGVALVAKGFTKDLLLEVAVFLVSAKLIISSYQNAVYTKALLARLDEVKALLEQPPRPGR